MKVGVERHEPRSGPSRPPRPVPGADRIPLVQAAMRRRQAERAFEDYVREMSRRWGVDVGPRRDGPGAGDMFPEV